MLRSDARDRVAVLVLGVTMTAACGLTSGSRGETDEGAGGSGGSGGGGLDGGVATTAGGQGGALPDATTTGSTRGSESRCDETSGFLPKRLTRLSLPQLAQAIEQLFGNELAAEIQSEFELPSGTDRAFPALAHPREGNRFVEGLWLTTDGIAQRAGEYASNHFESVSGCDASDVACAEAFLYELGPDAYRRPLTSDEETSLGDLIDTLIATEASAAELAQYGVYGLLSSPAFLYRTEFGSDAERAGPLTSFELADQLAYFLSDAPPDAELKELAREGRLHDEAVLEQQALRLLAERSVQQNLSGAFHAYFGLTDVERVVIDPALAPAFDEAMRRSMRREAEAFVDRFWRREPLSDLLFGRQSFVDERLAALYGVEFPPSDAELDADGFARVELPQDRAGLLTMPAFLATSSRPDAVSVVRRGLRVVATLGCAAPPPMPEVEIPPELPVGVSQAEAAAIRAAEPTCAQCHDAFDPPGLALQRFGLIGEYRDLDETGAPIDSSATLADGTEVSGAVDLAAHFVVSGDFSACMSKAWLSYALQILSETVEPCAYESIAQNFRESSGTLSDLLVAVATAPVLRERSAD